MPCGMTQEQGIEPDSIVFVRLYHNEKKQYLPITLCNTSNLQLISCCKFPYIKNFISKILNVLSKSGVQNGDFNGRQSRCLKQAFKIQCLPLLPDLSQFFVGQQNNQGHEHRIVFVIIVYYQHVDFQLADLAK